MRVPAPLLLIGSGAAALGYQVVWARFLALTLGATTEAVSTVLAAFFLGLALGAAAAPRLLAGREAMRVFGGLEAAIGVCGAALAWALPGLPSVAAALPVDGTVGRFAASAVLLLVPTFCMGATFPVLAAAAVAGRANPEQGIGRLYAANTVGAALGAALSGYALIPALGLDGTAYLLAGVNGLVAAAALLSAGSSGTIPLAPASPAAEPPPADAAASLSATAVLLVTGVVSLATEVAWTKVLVLFTGATVYGFATILAVFLAGVAGGSAAARRFPVPPGRSRRRLALVLLALTVALLVTRAGLTLLPYAFEAVRAGAFQDGARVALRFAVIAALLLPPTVLLGACFPLALAVASAGAPGRRLGPLYAANTVAGVAGSLGAGFWWIPRYGCDAVLAGGAVLVALTAGALAAGLPRRTAVPAGAAVAATLLAVFAAPALRFEPLLAAVRYEYDAAAEGEPEFLFLREGRAAVVSAVTYDGSRVRFQSNGLNESIVSRSDPPVGSPAETMLALVPWALHQDARRCFVVGYGGGVTARALLAAGVSSVRVAELEPAMLAAVREVLGPAAGLDDPRLDLVIDDARHRLLRDDRSYDVVVSQPSHPWLAGGSALFTREFFELVRSRLEEDGLFAQWINLFNMDVPTLGSLVRTFFDAFPNGFVLALPRSGDLILVGALHPVRAVRADFEQDLRHPELTELLHACRIERPIDILGHFVWSRTGALAWAGDSPPNTDRNVLSEVRLAALRLRSDPLPTDRDPYVLIRERSAFDLASVFHPDVAPGVVRDLAVRLVRRGERVRARRLMPRLAELDPALADSLERALGSRAQPVPGGAR
jgi:spermidine synthase